MGTYFKTCLSFGDVNQMSVLANAHDANKQVAFLFGQRDGRRVVLARMLLVLSKERTLLRYHCYAADQLAERCTNLLLDYVARRAGRLGIRLADDGEVEHLDEKFWYDDGVCEWSAASQQAWNEEAMFTQVATPCGAELVSEAVVV